MTALDVYETADGTITRRYYAELEKRGPAGLLALNLFRAQKCSSRAKVYRGGMRGVGSFRGMAYERKQWSLDQLSQILTRHGAELGIRWGWKRDPASFIPWVLYVDLPQGQVSFHSPVRGAGMDYAGEWDREHRSAERILQFCDSVMKGEAVFQPLLTDAY